MQINFSTSSPYQKQTDQRRSPVLLNNTIISGHAVAIGSDVSRAATWLLHVPENPKYHQCITCVSQATACRACDSRPDTATHDTTHDHQVASHAQRKADIAPHTLGNIRSSTPWIAIPKALGSEMRPHYQATDISLDYQPSALMVATATEPGNACRSRSSI